MIQIKQNPRITKLENDIARNNNAIAFHREKIEALENANKKLLSDIEKLKNNDIINLIAASKISYEKLEKLLMNSDDTEKEEGVKTNES